MQQEKEEDNGPEQKAGISRWSRAIKYISSVSIPIRIDTVEIYFIDIDICISMSMFIPKVITMDNNKYRIRSW